MKRNGLSFELRAIARKGLSIGLACATFTAHALSFTFFGVGEATGPAQTPPAFTGLEVLPASTACMIDGATGWTLSSQFSFNAATLIGQRCGTFAKGLDSLAFTFTSTSTALGAPLFLAYSITGGTGAYAGLAGNGSSQVQLLGNPLGLPTAIPYLETAGTLNLAPVPEPATWMLLAAGLAGLLGYKSLGTPAPARRELPAHPARARPAA